MKFSKTGGKQTSAPWLYGQDEAILTPMQRFGVASTSILRRLVRFSYRVKIQIRIVLLYITPAGEQTTPSKCNAGVYAASGATAASNHSHIMFESYLNTYMQYQP